MFPSATISNSTTLSEEASLSPATQAHDHFNNLNPLFTPTSPHPKQKTKRSQPGNPDPDAEVVSLSPKSLVATNRFLCEICGKGFQRDQNLQLHRRGHNLPWRLRQRNSGKEPVKKRVYVCPEPSCVHHHPSRALGDLTGIKKHFSRKHGEKKWKCERCSKKYAVYSDWKAHAKTCGTREYRCDCGTLFSRKDSFITHRAFCDALAEESARLFANSSPTAINIHSFPNSWNPSYNSNPNPDFLPNPNPNPNPNSTTSSFGINRVDPFQPWVNPYLLPSAAGRLTPINGGVDFDAGGFSGSLSVDRSTRDFLGVDSGGIAIEEFLPCVDDGRNGDHTAPAAGFGFPPVTGAWGDS